MGEQRRRLAYSKVEDVRNRSTTTSRKSAASSPGDWNSSLLRLLEFHFCCSHPRGSYRDERPRCRFGVMCDNFSSFGTGVPVAGGQDARGAHLRTVGGKGQRRKENEGKKEKNSSGNDIRGGFDADRRNGAGGQYMGRRRSGWKLDHRRQLG